MEPLRFKVKDLYSHSKQAGGMALYAHYLTPCEDYSSYKDTCDTRDYFWLCPQGVLNSHFCKNYEQNIHELVINKSHPLESFIVPKEHWQAFKTCIHSYNMKYCNIVVSVEGLDGFAVWFGKQVFNDPKCFPSKIQHEQVVKMIQEYKRTLPNWNTWFEEGG